MTEFDNDGTPGNGDLDRFYDDAEQASSKAAHQIDKPHGRESAGEYQTFGSVAQDEAEKAVLGQLPPGTVLSRLGREKIAETLGPDPLDLCKCGHLRGAHDDAKHGPESLSMCNGKGSHTGTLVCSCLNFRPVETDPNDDAPSKAYVETPIEREPQGFTREEIAAAFVEKDPDFVCECDLGPMPSHKSVDECVALLESDYAEIDSAYYTVFKPALKQRQRISDRLRKLKGDGHAWQDDDGIVYETAPWGGTFVVPCESTVNRTWRDRSEKPTLSAKRAREYGFEPFEPAKEEKTK